jgi:hypothetical protein
VAVIVAVAAALIALVVTWNIAEDDPAGTITDTGTCKAEELPERVIVVAVDDDRDTVTMHAADPLGPKTAGLHWTEDNTAPGACSAIVVDRLSGPRAPVTIAEPAALTSPVVAVKAAEEDPAATVTDAGTRKSVELLDSATVVAAATEPDSLTVQVADALESIVTGLHSTAESTGAAARRLIDADLLTPFSAALMPAEPPALIMPVDALNVAEDDPAATFTEVGTRSCVELLARAIVVVAVAVIDRVTVQAAEPFELSTVRLHTTLFKAGRAAGGVAMVPPLTAIPA